MTVKRISFVFLVLLTGALYQAGAQTITAASCNASDVQTAFNAVVNTTTTVIIPAGTCAWTTAVSLTVPSGSSTITIQGATTVAGSGDPASNNLSVTDNTIIVDNNASNNSLLTINANTSPSLIRLTGMTFEGGSGADKYHGIIVVNGSTTNFRFDHSHINTSTYSPSNSSDGIGISGCIYGVVDHTLFDNIAGAVNNMLPETNAGSCFGDPLGDGDQSWHNATSLGSSSFMYAEQNVFNSGAANDCTQGGRFVFRFNTFNATSPEPTVQTHPTGGAGRHRGCRAWEIYGNAFNADASNYINAGFWVSSGTGVVWGNKIPASSAGGGTGYKNFIQMQSMRQNNGTYSQTVPPGGWGYCGTDFNGTGSNWDQNSNAASGYHCLDQPGMGVGDLLTGGFSSDGSGSNNVCDITQNPSGCSSYTGQWVNEAVEPIYEWMDAFSPVPSNPSALLGVNSTFGNTPNFVANTDYYLWCNASSQTGCTSFTGATGVGNGALASAPSTCTQGVGYFATDQGSWNQSGNGFGNGVLYRCGPSSSFASFYTPYTYPHPLESSTPTLAPPTQTPPNVVVH
jgi:hypothetical protein